MGNKASNNDDEKQTVKISAEKKSVVKALNKEMQKLYQYRAKYEVNENGSVTFWPTPNCKPSQEALQADTVNLETLLSQQNCKQLLMYSDPDARIVQGGATCSFLVAALRAWSEHYPFRFKPEHIWLLILQGVAVHVDKNAEKLRGKYVKHDGKMKLLIDVPANPSRKDFQGVIEYFVEEIDKYTVGDTGKLFDCDFSSSTLTERIATKVTIMDICKNYFDYSMQTLCGFPELTIDGTKQDWINLKQKTEKLLVSKVDKKFGEQWGKALLPLLDRFIAAFEGNIDCVFWNSMIKRGAVHGSGAYDYYCGWFNILFPFLKEDENRYCVPYAMDRAYVAQGFVLDGVGGFEFGSGETGGDVNEYPTGLASAPVTWNRLGHMIDLKFVAGFVGFQQDAKTLEICPNIGWCIAEAKTQQKIEDAKPQNKMEEEIENAMKTMQDPDFQQKILEMRNEQENEIEDPSVQ